MDATDEVTSFKNFTLINLDTGQSWAGKEAAQHFG
jgi:hypothetical protein